KPVILSFKKKADKTNTTMGTTVIITEAWIGVVYSRPLKKVNMFKAMPKTEAKNSMIKSLDSMRCLGVNKLKIQNKMAAPKTRIKIKPKGFINPSSITSLANVKVKP